MKRLPLLTLLSAALVLSTGGHNRIAASPPPSNPAELRAPAPTSTAGYTLMAWSELGMHCMDGKDYSIFSVLPPYNIIHAQLIQKTDPPTIINSGVTITYQSTADTKGSINSSSSTKTNFWNYVNTLFLTNPPPETGIAGYKTQSTKANNLTYNSTVGYWEAVGVPTVPYDDKGVWNPYSMAILTAKDSSGNVLATAKIVLAVSDEMSCKNCHASGTDTAAEPASGWVYNSDPAKDPKLNILKKHDDRWNISNFLPQLAKNGYTYQSSLYQTAVSGTPVLCAACHSDNALSASGLSGIGSLSKDVHDLHGPQINPATGITLNKTHRRSQLLLSLPPGPRNQVQAGRHEQNDVCELSWQRKLRRSKWHAQSVAHRARVPDVPQHQPALYHNICQWKVASNYRHNLRDESERSDYRIEPLPVQSGTRRTVLLRMSRLAACGVSHIASQ